MFIGSDNGPKFVARSIWEWINTVGAGTVHINPDTLREINQVESRDTRFRDELLFGQVFYTLREAEVAIEHWRRHYNCVRPYSALG